MKTHMYIVVILLNLLAAGLIGFGIEGCSRGSGVHGWAIFAGFCLIGPYGLKKNSASEEEDSENRENKV